MSSAAARRAGSTPRTRAIVERRRLDARSSEVVHDGHAKRTPVISSDMAQSRAASSVR
jgi:hypothetical protein